MEIRLPKYDLCMRPDQIEDDLNIFKAFVDGAKAFLLAHSCGVGKTRVACSLAAGFENPLIVAPLSTFGGWLQEAAVVGLELKPMQLVNYESMHKVDAAQPIDLLVLDECHKTKGRNTKRFKMFLDLRNRAKRLLFLSATPGSSPLDLSYLGDVFGFDPVKGFWKWAHSFKGVHRNKWNGLTFMPGFKEDTERLSKLIEGNPLAIRRTPQQIGNWPELQRIIQPVLLDDTQRKLYEDAFKSYLREVRAEGRRLHWMAHALVAVGQFRKRISLLKAKATADFARTFLEQNMVVVISCEYLDTLAAIDAGLEGYQRGKITGMTPQPTRQIVLDMSKRDELDVILTTVSEGVNLHQQTDGARKRIQILADQPWSALKLSQIEGRVHRAGRSALVYWMVCADSVDAKVAKRLSERMQTLNAIVGEENLQEIIDLSLTIS